MRPSTLRSLLSSHCVSLTAGRPSGEAEVLRLFLKPEESAVTEKRKKRGGNRKQNYTCGWVEISDKRVAKGLALSLNNRPIGGKKGHRYYDDIWNMQYLKGFKWTDLTADIHGARTVREQRIRANISQANRETKEFLENISKEKAIQAIIERKEKKRKESPNDEGEEEERKEEKRRQRRFHQRQLISKDQSRNGQEQEEEE